MPISRTANGIDSASFHETPVRGRRRCRFAGNNSVCRRRHRDAGGDIVLELTKIHVQIAGRLVTAARDLGEGLVNDPAELQREVGARLEDRLRLLADDLAQSVMNIFTGESSTTRDHLVEHRTEREQVCAVINFLPVHLLRCHVPRRPHHLASDRA